MHFLKGVIEEIPLPARHRRRRDLELRDQPVDRQGRRADGDRARAQAGRPGRDERRRRRGPPDAGGAGRARLLRRLHRGCAVEGRVCRGARGGRLRAGLGRVHARGRRRHARRDRQGCQDDASRRRRDPGDRCRSEGGLLQRAELRRALVAEADRDVRARLRRLRRDHGRREDTCSSGTSAWRSASGS